MIDRVRFPAGHGRIDEADLIGFVAIDGSAFGVVRLDNGRYRSVNMLHLERVVDPMAAAIERLTRPAAEAA